MEALPSFLHNLPVIQTFAYFSQLFKMIAVGCKIDAISSEHTKFTEDVLEEQEKHDKKVMKKEKIKDFVKVLKDRAQENSVASTALDKIIAEAKTMKLFETFLETAPQTVLQLYIIMQQAEEITNTQMTTLIKSFSFFLFGAIKNYLGPTKVYIYKILGGMLNSKCSNLET